MLRAHTTLPETNIAPENGWLALVSFPFGARPIFRGKLAVSFRECTCVSDCLSRVVDLHHQADLKAEHPPVVLPRLDSYG